MNGSEDSSREKLIRMSAYPKDNLYCLEPRGFRPEQKTGLFLFMHGGDRSTPKSAPYDNYIGPGGSLRPFLESLPFITAAPSAPDAPDGKRWNRPGCTEYLEAVIREMESRYNIDQDRIIIGGYSMGGCGAYHQGQLLADRAAGLWLAAGAWLEADFRSMLGTPVYILHGKYDCAAHYSTPHPEPRHHDWCGVSFARAAHELMLRDDIAHVYDEHDGGHAVSWEPTQMAVRRFVNWAVRQKRQPFAPRIALVTPRGSADPALEMRPHSRWLELNEAADGEIDFDKIMLTGPNIAHTIDELNAQSYCLTKVRHKGSRILACNDGNNHFTVTAENVKVFTIFTAPGNSDPAKPFTVECNGRKYSCRAGKSDRRPPYTAFIRVEL